jgi:hypothetical protein
MKDLDFDELDRAVNSLITSIPGQTPNDTETPVPVATDDTPSISTVTSPVSQRSTGRFMDVVHPSSDMRTTAPIPERVSRQGMAVNPTPLLEMPSLPPRVPASTPVDIPPEQPTWPDPISFQEQQNNQAVPQAVPKEAPQEESAKDEDADIDQINDDITNTLNQANNELPDSPFIPGTKVEKRPLGAFSSEPTEPKSETPVPEPNKPVIAGIGLQSNEINTPFPAELQNNLLSIEADSVARPELLDAIDKSTVVNVASPEQVAVTPAPMPTIPTTTTTPTPTPTIAPVPDNQPVSGSIAQQYKEQPSTGDQKTGAIYDTDSYHKTPLHSTKKKSGWMWVLWIVIILLVGAGAGAVVYFFVLTH